MKSFYVYMKYFTSTPNISRLHEIFHVYMKSYSCQRLVVAIFVTNGLPKARQTRGGAVGWGGRTKY